MDYTISKLKIRAQVLIETSLFLVVMIVALLMLIRIWVWSNNQFAGRQQAYNNSRIEAGTVAGEQPASLIWVEENTARGDRRVYTPERLTRERIFEPYLSVREPRGRSE